jgi:hypothetical protein
MTTKEQQLSPTTKRVRFDSSTKKWCGRASPISSNFNNFRVSRRHLIVPIRPDDITHNDVLFCDDVNIRNKHPGNRRLMHAIKHQKLLYRLCTREQQNYIAQSLVEAIGRGRRKQKNQNNETATNNEVEREGAGRFLVYDVKYGSWVEMDKKTAISVTSKLCIMKLLKNQNNDKHQRRPPTRQHHQHPVRVATI